MAQSVCVKGRISKLTPYAGEVQRLREGGTSLRDIADLLKRKYSLDVTYNAVFSFLKTRDASAPQSTPFFRDLPGDIRDALIRQLTALWTFDSTSIEGNTLTLGETIKVLELGLTISGKPLKDHEEVYGHGKAIELVYDLIRKEKIDAKDLCDLHRCIMQKSPIDSLRPIGSWKRDFNGTTGMSGQGADCDQYIDPGGNDVGGQVGVQFCFVRAQFAHVATDKDTTSRA